MIYSKDYLEKLTPNAIKSIAECSQQHIELVISELVQTALANLKQAKATGASPSGYEEQMNQYNLYSPQRSNY